MTEENPEVKLVKIKDPISQTEVEVPENLQNLINHLIEFNKKIGKQAIEEKYKPLLDTAKIEKEQNEKLQTALDEMEKVGKTDKEQMALDNEKILLKLADENKKLKEQNKGLITSESENFKNSKLRKAMSGYVFNNNEQALASLKNDGTIEIEEIDGERKVFINMKLPNENGTLQDMKLEPEMAVKGWLAQEQNLYHLKSKIKPGGGTVDLGNSPPKGEKEQLIAQMDAAKEKKDFVEIIKLKGQLTKLNAQ